MSDGRARMLDRIRASLHTNRELLAGQAAQLPPPHPRGPFAASDQDRVTQFETELTALHAHVHRCAGGSAALELVCELLERAGAQQALTWATDQLPLPELLPTLEAAGIAVVDREVLGRDRSGRYAALEPVAAGITGVDAAIAESGTLLLVSGPGRGRLASLLPPLHIALLPEERLVRTLPEAWDLLRARFGADLFRDRSNLTLITGPSRTADIELSLTLGVHGPREVHAIILQEQPSFQEGVA